MQEEQKRPSRQDELKKDLKKKGVTIPIIFAVVAVIICIIFSNPHLNIFPSGNHKDSLTTTEPTKTTEFNEDEFAHNVQD